MTAATAQQQQQRTQQPAEPFDVQRTKGLLEQVLDNTSKKLRTVTAVLETEDRIAKIEQVLPDNMRGQARRLVKRALMTLSSKAELQDCPADEFCKIVIKAAEVGMAVDGRLAYVVKYKSTWQLQFDYKGLIAIAKRAGQITDCYGDVVCEGDEFEAYRKDGKSFLEHRVSLEQRGKVRAAYAIVNLPGGAWRYELMTRDELDKIQRSAPAKNGPWASWTGEMQKKSVIRRLLKTYCDDPAIVRAIEIDDEAYEDEPAPDITGRVKSKLQEARQRLGQSFHPAAAPQEPGDNGAADEPDEPAAPPANGNVPGKHVEQATSPQPAPAPVGPGAEPAPVPPSQSAEDAEQDQMGMQDMIDALRDRTDSAATGLDLQAVGADLNKHRKWLGEDRYQERLLHLQARNRQLAAGTQPAAPATGKRTKS